MKLNTQSVQEKLVSVQKQLAAAESSAAGANTACDKLDDEVQCFEADLSPMLSFLHDETLSPLSHS